MDSEQLLDLHLSLAELHDQIWGFAQIAGMVSADMAVVVKLLGEARGHLRERHYNLAVQSLASATRAIARAERPTYTIA